MSLRQWSVWRIVGVWLGWPLVLAALGLAAALLAIWRATPPLPPGATARPTLAGDVAFVLPPFPVVPLLVAGPPVLLTAVWLWQRGRRRSGPA